MSKPKTAGGKDDATSLAMFACPNPDCDRFNQFDAGNLSVVERMGKNQSIRRLYCNHCQKRFSERQGSLMQYTKLPEATVVRIIKCLGHGCSEAATADICEVDPRSVHRMLERAGRRAEDFHNLQMQRLREMEHEPIEAVELDELHARVCKQPPKKGSLAAASTRASGAGAVVRAVAAWVERGFTRRWRASRDS
jgi:transposase-like protein